MLQQFIHSAAQTQHHNAGHTNGQTDGAQRTALEGGHRRIVRRDIHGLHNEQIVVQRDDGVDQRQEHHQIVALMEGGSKHKELAEESGNRLNDRRRRFGCPVGL